MSPFSVGLLLFSEESISLRWGRCVCSVCVHTGTHLGARGYCCVSFSVAGICPLSSSSLCLHQSVPFCPGNFFLSSSHKCCSDGCCLRLVSRELAVASFLILIVFLSDSAKSLLHLFFTSALYSVSSSVSPFQANFSPFAF